MLNLRCRTGVRSKRQHHSGFAEILRCLGAVLAGFACLQVANANPPPATGHYRA